MESSTSSVLERKTSRASSTASKSDRNAPHLGGGNGSVSSEQESAEGMGGSLPSRSRSASQRANRQSRANGSVSPKVPRKFIATWRHACDKTKDRTKDFIKKWRTLPEPAELTDDMSHSHSNTEKSTPPDTTGWSVHVWTTWVSRCPSQEDESLQEGSVCEGAKTLTKVQKDKLRHFFSNVFDIDKDDLISTQDFDSFSERLKHFADWSDNSNEFSTLRQVQQGFVDDFILVKNAEKEVFNTQLEKEVVTIEEWLDVWGNILENAHNLHHLPVWLQYLPKLLFNAINRTGSGIITREELSSFYSSVLGLSPQRVDEIIDEAYNAMTANGDHALKYSIYRLCFANFLLGRHPNGSGQYLFGFVAKRIPFFPVDYSAMNTPPEELETYTPNNKSNRHSVIV